MKIRFFLDMLLPFIGGSVGFPSSLLQGDDSHPKRVFTLRPLKLSILLLQE